MYITNRETAFEKCKHIGEVNVFSYIITHCNKETLRWFSTKEDRIAIAKKYGIGESSISRYLINLVNYGLLEKRTKGEYKINEQYIGGGLTNSEEK